MSHDLATDDGAFNGWLSMANLRLIEEQVGTPVFIYSEEQLLRNIQRVTDAAKAAAIEDRVEFYVPFFPNSNPHILTSFQGAGIGILLQLPAEYELLSRLGFDNFIVSTGHVSDQDIAYWVETGYPIFLSSLDEISYLVQHHPQASINVRFDSLNSGKPGIKYSELKVLSDFLEQHQRGLDCFELYCGSGHSLETMLSVVEQVFMIFSTYFPSATSINFAGGFGFDYAVREETKKHFEWDKYFAALCEITARYNIPRHVKFLFEPARDVLGDVGTLLLSVERGIISHPGANRVLTNGSRVLMPSAQYKERHHNVVFLDSSFRELIPGNIRAALRGRGVLRHDYVLPGEYLVPDNISRDDYVLILDVGAYCATQHMEFLNIPPAAEVVIDRFGVPHLITAAADKFDKWRHLLPERKELASHMSSAYCPSGKPSY